MSEIMKKLEVALADTYALYLKTQNYHWHVRGVQFKTLHELFDMQYRELADAVDQIAERILTMGAKTAPATFTEFNKLRKITDGNPNISANEMVKELAADHSLLVKDFNQAVKIAENLHDEGTITFISDRIVAHEKAHWMLKSSMEV